MSLSIKKSYDSIIKNYPPKSVKDLSIHFMKEDTQMTDKPIKKCSTSLVIKKMKIKTTMKYP